MLTEDKVEQSEILQSQINRILHSDEFRSCEVLRRLLAYLGEKAASGEADQLKEYVIAIEGLGKPSSYDPQQNSAVRIQVGRLRHKLAEYYRGEGKDDEIVVDLPKGRFRLIYQHRQSLAEPLPIADSIPAVVSNIRPASRPAVNRRPLFRPVPLSILGGSLLVLLVGGLFAVQTWHVRDAAVVEGLTPELSKLWAPFLNSRRPLIISIEDPLFAEVRSNPGVYFRDRSMNQWKDVVNSPAVKTLTGTLKQTDIQPSRYYTAFGEVDASFMFGKLLGRINWLLGGPLRLCRQAGASSACQLVTGA